MVLPYLTSSTVQRQNAPGLRVLERAAVYQDVLESTRDQLSTRENHAQARLSAEYFVLRTVLVSLDLIGLLEF